MITNKNSELLIFQGYAYIKHRTLSDYTLSWYCAQNSSNDRVRTKEYYVETVTDHCHFSDPADIEKPKFRKPLKDRAAVSDVTLSVMEQFRLLPMYQLIVAFSLF